MSTFLFFTSLCPNTLRQVSYGVLHTPFYLYQIQFGLKILLVYISVHFLFKLKRLERNFTLLQFLCLISWMWNYGHNNGLRILTRLSHESFGNSFFYSFLVTCITLLAPIAAKSVFNAFQTHAHDSCDEKLCRARLMLSRF